MKSVMKVLFTALAGALLFAACDTNTPGNTNETASATNTESSQPVMKDTNGTSVAGIELPPSPAAALNSQNARVACEKNSNLPPGQCNY